jgi:hypothetical protein
MADAFRGLYRTVAWAYVTNGAMAFQVHETEYRTLGYEPEYSRLPWKDDYIARLATTAREPAVQASAQSPSQSLQVALAARHNG